MKLAIFAYSRRGCETARRIIEFLHEDETRAFASARLEQPDFAPTEKPTVPFYGAEFSWADAMIFVGSCGIAVREIAPHVRDKRTDPAVLCVDELGHFVIPILSGHIGGANALAGKLAGCLSAVPVITTATDINHKFSVDAWAASQGFAIGSMKLAKAVSAAILEGDVPMASQLPVAGNYPPGTVPGETGPLGIHIGWSTENPFIETLHLIAPVLHLGIGCRKGTARDAIAQAVETVLRENHIDKRAIRCAASIDLKAEEAGLLEYCKEQNLPIRFYTGETLAAVEGDFTPSAFVKSITGVDTVCERSAMMGADRLIVKKTALSGVTVAVAAEHREVSF